MGGAGLLAQRDLLWRWTVRDLQVRYQGSFLGNAWAVLHPLATLAVYTFVFSVVLNLRFGPPGHGGFAIFLMAGLLPWLAFAETTQRATTAITGNANLVKKVVFPLAVLPVSLVASSLVNMAIGLAILLVVVAATAGLGPALAWLPVVVLVQVAFTLGVAWLLASLGVFVRDLQVGIGLLLNVVLYLSPVLYPASAVPAAWRWLFDFNPIAFWVEAYRGAILDGHGPALLPLAGHAALAVAVMALGYAWFAKTRRAFADVL
jgi:lipopolysaccharide transport system permease protein